MNEIIKVENVSYVYSKGTPFQKIALDNVSVSFEKGKITGLIGHTGSGKSTLVSLLNGLIRPTEGRILLNGVDIWEKPKEIAKIRFKVGVVMQYPEYQLFEDTVWSDIGFGPKNQGLSEEEIKTELVSSSSAIEKVTGVKPILFRAPYGDYNDCVINTAKSLSLYTIQWDVDSLDWKNLSAMQIATRVINGANNGSIILCHNNGLHTAEALPMIFATLKNRGYQFVPIGELIYKDGYEIDGSGKQWKNEKTIEKF